MRNDSALWKIGKCAPAHATLTYRCAVGTLAVLVCTSPSLTHSRLATGQATAATTPYSSDHHPVVVATVAGNLTTYNLGNAPDEEVRADLLALAGRPGPVIVCQEAGDRHAVLKDVPGWRTLQAPPHSHARDHLALLVRSGVPVLRRLRIARLSGRTYVGHNAPGARRTGRAEHKWIASVVIRAHGQRLVIGDTHLTPPESRRARALFARQAARAATWEASADRILLGDFQRPPDYARLAALRHVATAHAAPSHRGLPIDMGWTHTPATAWAMETR